MNEFNTLAHICKELHISRKVIQGYEKHGLVCPQGKDRYGHLIYDYETTKRIIRIRFYQKLGFSVKEIQDFIDSGEYQIREVLIQKKKEIGTKIDSFRQKEALITSLIEQKTELDMEYMFRIAKEEEK